MNPNHAKIGNITILVVFLIAVIFLGDLSLSKSWASANGKSQITIGDIGYPTLASAVAKINAAGINCTLFLPPTFNETINSNITVNSNITIKGLKGCNLAIASNKTLTINGSFEAGLFKVFSWIGTGKIDFANAKVSCVYPQWWGAVGDCIADDFLAINATVHSGAKKIVFIDTGSPYQISDVINLISNQEIVLENRSTIRQTSTAINPILPIFRFKDVHDISIRGGILEGLNTSGLGPVYPTNIKGLLDYVGNPYNILIEDIEVRYSYDAGIQIVGLSSTNIKMVRVHVHHNACYGIAVPSGDVEIIDANVHDNQYAGIDCGGFWAYGTLSIIGGRFWQNGGYHGGGTQDYGSWCGILLFGTRRANIIGPHVYSNGCEGIKIDTPNLSTIPQDITITGARIHGHLTTNNPSWTPAGIRVLGGYNISINNNNSYDNYDNFTFQPTDSADGYIPLKNITCIGNRSSGAKNKGYVASRPISRKSSEVLVGEVIWGMSFIGNSSWNDAKAYDIDTFGVFQTGSLKIPVTETLGSEIVANSGFETGGAPLSNWHGNGVTLKQVTDNRPGSSRTKAVELEVTVSGGSGYSDDVALTANTLYKVDVWVKRLTDSDSRPRIAIEKIGGGREYESWWDGAGELPIGTWKQHTGYFVASATANFHILLLGGAKVGDLIRFDEVSIKAVTSIPTGEGQ